MASKICLSNDDYTVGWICALPPEMAAAKTMLDEIHGEPTVQSNDHNAYIFGRIGTHNVVVACLPSGQYGTTSAAVVAMQLLSSFHSIRFGLMVGIGAGVPSEETDIRLGDVAVSEPTDTNGGVVQYDLGKALEGGEFQRTGMLNRPPQSLLTALSKLRANHLTEESQMASFLADIERKFPKRAANFARPTEDDNLFLSNYSHNGKGTKACNACDTTQTVRRASRDHSDPVIHYGVIASANRVVKDSQLRDQLSRELGAICVEMEAAGLMSNYPCIVIRGICDYADSHKNGAWQGYAAAVAAAYAKELLLTTSTSHIDQTCTARDRLATSVQVHNFRVPLDLTSVPVIESFLGRPDELEQLWHYLQPAHDQSRKVAILHGLGGMGKTQLAIRFAREHKNDFTAIFWLSGKSRSALLQSLGSVLARIPGYAADGEATKDEEVEQRARQVLQWLATEGNSRWLMILDNVDHEYFSKDPDTYDLRDFFPTADHGSILITSRLAKLAELGRSFPVERLEPKAAMQLLLQSSGLSRRDNMTEKGKHPDIELLADRLDGLPLAIVIAGAFIRETGSSVTEYLQFYNNSWYELQSASSVGHQYQQGNLMQTWMVSYRDIQMRDPDAAEVLLLISHFDNRDIWYELVKSGGRHPNAPAWLTRAVSSALAFKAIMRTLIGFSLVETSQRDGSYALHPVVQDWCLEVSRKGNEESLTLFRELALLSVGYMAIGLGDKQLHRNYRRLLSHAKFIHHEDLESEHPAILNALLGLGLLHFHVENWKEAESMYQRSLLGFEKLPGPCDKLNLNYIKNFVQRYPYKDRPKEAESIYQRILLCEERLLGPDHVSTLATVNHLGNIYLNQGRLREAEHMYQRALTGFENWLGQCDASDSRAMYSLAVAYRKRGEIEKANESYRQTLLVEKRARGPAHISYLHCVRDLATFYAEQNDLEGAKELFQQALTGYDNALGPDHTYVLHTLADLGKMYRHEGQRERAEEMFRRAITGFENICGPNHESTLEVVNNLGYLYLDQGKLKDAEKLLQRVLDGRENALGSNNPSTSQAAATLAYVYWDQGKLQEAEVLFQHALAGRENALGSNNLLTLNSAQNLGVVYAEQGKFQEAEMMLQRALAGIKDLLGPNHTYSLSVARSLGLLYMEQGKFEEAGAICQIDSDTKENRSSSYQTSIQEGDQVGSETRVRSTGHQRLGKAIKAVFKR
ncbi:Pfs, NB-ARC and TPR domain protein [Aspergillus ibericus CBS 121593]|uniref:Pfs, NB-ARC and TPR domain protein n=1 Tax=Aspergillus ibericus CBS 121593 TaxID=1448316 RepID=A0A395GRK3_9EURO|nr:Pfs, NB-ARC and TPR domain protein [Aspergillus ibericus CBS 121593]RAK97337.1 Pfs, NB-ARC and TPR domain protein [Aspergillus ibericus CBS 121593]